MTSFDEESFVHVKSNESHEEKETPLPKCDPSKAFTGEIVEREFSIPVKTANSSRPVSKFKANKIAK